MKALYEELRTAYTRGCVFCDPPSELVLHRGEHFGIVADVAPLRAGHVILHSLEHHSCAGDVPRQEIPELLAYRADLYERFTKEFGEFGAYEHGRAGHCLSDGFEHRLCHHFHLHVLPGPVPVTEKLAARFHRVPLPDYGDIGDAYDSYGDYLYVEDGGGSADLFPVGGAEVERHLLRTLVAEADGTPHIADWKAFAEQELFEQSLTRLRQIWGD